LAIGRTLITGANGRLGRRLLRHLAAGAPAAVPRAVVRSRAAADALSGLPGASSAEVWIADYSDADALESAVAGCDRVAHLVGILRETTTARYADAHEGATRALVRAAERAGVRRIVYLSVLGADVRSRNPCLASKGRAEQLLLEAKTPATVLRVAMVLGPGELAAAALRARARGRVAFLVRGGASLEQPIDADDLTSAIARALEDDSGAHRVLDVAGPESLPRRELVARAAAVFGRRPRILGVPLFAARIAARALSVLPDPPLTPAMLGVLEHDDRVDPLPACRALGLELTPLDVTLRRCLEPPRAGR
jgi:NADH dehydrogenase